MPEILPVFRAAPTRAIAEACSELTVRGSEFKTFSEHPGAQFPPEPCYQSGVSIAYLDDACELQQRTMLIPQESAPLPKLQRAFSVGYSSLVGPLQDKEAIIEADQRDQPLKAYDIPELKLSAIKHTQRAKLRTVAGFVLFTSPSGNNYGGMYVPKTTYEGLPIENRQRMQDYFRLLGVTYGELVKSGQGREWELNAISEVLHNGPAAKNLPMFIGALLLPPAKVNQKPAQDNISRRERRAAERKRR